MFTVIYRWRIRAAHEAEFIAAWHSRTENIYRIRHSYGSRLHRQSDGVFCAIALWPSEEAWAAAEPLLPNDEADAAAFAASIQQTFETLTMVSVDDLWKIPET